MIEFITSYVILVLTVAGLTSGILYSELVKEWKDAWIKYWSKAKYLSKLQHYGKCQLCLSVPVCLAIQWLFLPYFSVVTYILFSVSVAFISWMLSAFTLMCLNVKWAAEEYAKYRRAEFQRGARDVT